MEKKKLLKNKIVDTLPVLYLETVILMVLGQFLGNFVLGIPVGIAYARNPEILNSAFLNTTLMYVIFWGIWAVALFWIGIRKRNRPILQAVGTKPQGNNWKYLLFGLVLGFALNGFCILIAWLHHDIVLTYDAIHPLWFVVVFLTVFIQSSAEELLCRGFLYQKLRRSYKNPVVAIVGNALLFALLHLANNGVTVLSVLNIFWSEFCFPSWYITWTVSGVRLPYIQHGILRRTFSLACQTVGSMCRIRYLNWMQQPPGTVLRITLDLVSRERSLRMLYFLWHVYCCICGAESMERSLWMCGQKHNIISILRKRHQVTSGAVQLCIRPRNGKRDILCNYSGQNEPYRLHPY